MAMIGMQPQRLPFRKELERLINRESRESGSNTPDFILAEYLIDALAAFDRAVMRREQWYGRDPAYGSDLKRRRTNSGSDFVSFTDHLAALSKRQSKKRRAGKKVQ